MKRFCLLFVLLLFIFTNFVFADKVAILPDILKPDSITVDNNQLFITEGASIYIYSLKDFSLEKKFGKEGEGPKEFKITSYGGSGLILDVQPEVLLISSVGKLSIFTRAGTFKKELKAPYSFFGNAFLGMGHRFVGMCSTMGEQESFITVNIYDAELNKVKEVCRWESPFRPGAGTRVFTEPYIFQATENKIFTAGGKEFKINVFDSNGKKLYSINQKYEDIKISEGLKKAVINYFKTSPSTKNVFQFMQPIKFPDYFPAILSFLVKDNKIYVLTYKKKDHKHECFVFDLKGKLLKKVFLPVIEQTLVSYYPFNINDGKLYQLLENEEAEEWELHVTEINKL
ncbi:MAG: hypothetical protein JSV88_14355 [Candidatus Aminicenantes bacterium]|nr:MAG: hypothetical protein JSV88_14355 [Candidatus Aminicenantes bacterium]